MRGNQRESLNQEKAEKKKEEMRLLPGPDGKIRHYRKISEKLIPVHSTSVRQNALVEFVDGPHRTLYGRIHEFEPPPREAKELQRCKVKLIVSQQIVNTVRADFDVIDEYALPRDHPV